MQILTVKLPPDLGAKLKALAKRRRSTKSAIVREALETLVATANDARSPSALDLAGDLVGCFDGPSDLSANPKSLEGFGLDRAQRVRLKR
jgi:hypothetical protein